MTLPSFRKALCCTHLARHCLCSSLKDPILWVKSTQEVGRVGPLPKPIDLWPLLPLGRCWELFPLGAAAGLQEVLLSKTCTSGYSFSPPPPELPVWWQWGEVGEPPEASHLLGKSPSQLLWSFSLLLLF